MLSLVLTSIIIFAPTSHKTEKMKLTFEENEILETGKVSAGWAAFFNYFPGVGVGYVQSGNWIKRWPVWVGQVAAMGVLVVGAELASHSTNNSKAQTNWNAVAMVGAASWAAITIYSMIDAYKLAKEQNRKFDELKTKLAEQESKVQFEPLLSFTGRQSELGSRLSWSF